MTQTTIAIGGMSCDHCVMAVRKELSKIPSLQVKEVKIGSVTVEFDEASVGRPDIDAAIREAGYSPES